MYAWSSAWEGTDPGFSSEQRGSKKDKFSFECAGAGSHDLRADSDNSSQLCSQHSVNSSWQLAVSHGGRIYNMETGKHCEVWLPIPHPCPKLRVNCWLAHHWERQKTRYSPALSWLWLCAPLFHCRKRQQRLDSLSAIIKMMIMTINT